MTAIPAHEIRHLDTRCLGRTVWAYPRLDSTNSLALELASDIANDGLVLLADEQTSGRGQYGREWTAPPGSSVLMTVLVLPPPALRRPALLTAWAAVSVCQAISDIVDLQPIIKWPNDVLIAGRKVCGILIEQRNTGHAEKPLAAAVGIGLNVSQTSDFFAQVNLPQAGSLLTLSGKRLDARTVAERLIRRLDEGYDGLMCGQTQKLESAWKNLLDLVGKQVLVETARGQTNGRIIDISWEHIVLDCADGVLPIPPESIRRLGGAPAV